MNLTEPPERSISTPTAGFLAVLGDLLCLSGIGASRVTSRIIVVLVAIVGALAFAATPALAIETHVVSQPIGSGEKGSGAGQLELAANSGITVNDATGNIYVADTGNDRIDEFESDGTFVRAWGWGVVDGSLAFETCGPDAFPPTATCRAGISGSGAGQFITPTFIAVDNSAGPSKGDVYIGDTGGNLVTKFSAEGALASTWGNTAPTPNGQLTGYAIYGINGIAVDSSGNLEIIGEFSEFFKFTQGGTFSEGFGFEISGTGDSRHGLAVDSKGSLFKANGFEPTNVEENTGSGSGVGPVSNPTFVGGFAVDAATGDLYIDTGSEVEQYVFSGLGIVSEQGATTCTVEPYPFAGCPATTSFGAGDIVGGAGVAVDASTHTVYVADAGAGRIDVFTGPVILPDVTTGAAAEVKAHSVKLVGTVDPDKEGAATCQFVWGTSKEFGHTAPCEPVDVPEGDSPVAVAAKLGELSTDTTYYYRLQATNKNGENAGQPSQDVEFTTAGPGIHGESASDVAASSVTLNASINPNNGPLSTVPNTPTSYYFQYSTASTTGCEASPSSCTSVPAAPGEAFGPGESDLEVSQHAQGLLAGAVYHFRVVALSEVAGELVTVAGPDQTFTTEVAGGGLTLPDGRQWELVSPPDKHGALLLPLQEGGGVVQAAVGGDAMTFLASAPTEGEPPGYSEEEQVLSTRGPDGWVSRDISPAHEHVAPLAVGEGQEYMAFSEDLSLAVLQPHGTFEPALSPEASEQTPYLRTVFLNGDVNDPCVEGCYRPLVTGKPGYANVEPGAAFGEACLHQAVCGPVFRGATSDLSRVAFWSGAPLLAGSGEGQEYEWFEGKLSQGNRLPEYRASTSEDGSWSYFVSGSALAPGAESGGNNLYVSHGGVTKLVAVLSNEDSPDWAGSSGNPQSGVVGDAEKNLLTDRTSRVSPDGEWLAFMSDRSLTGYDNEDVTSKSRGERMDEEVYLYHAPESLASGAGTLVCASCNPSGARPVGREVAELEDPEHGLAVMQHETWAQEHQQWIAANVPAWTGYKLESAVYQSRYLSDSGRLFFNGNDALVPQDVNGNEDVYEYEPPGVGDCTTASLLFSLRSGGCVGLVSSGQAAWESAFLDASGSGGDVFFLTAGRLVPQDYDNAFDVYDAHECTGAAPCFPTPAAVLPPCETGDACKPAPTPQPTIFGSAPSATFSGPGNITGGRELNPPPPKRVTKKTVKCRKGSVKGKKGKCVKMSKKGSKKARRAGNDRRAGQ